MRRGPASHHSISVIPPVGVGHLPVLRVSGMGDVNEPVDPECQQSHNKGTLAAIDDPGAIPSEGPRTLGPRPVWYQQAQHERYS
eukprot:3720770-Pyramimonas_sp.AAC.1